MAEKQEQEEEFAGKGEDIQVLRQLSSEVNSTLNLQEIYDILLRTLDQLFGFRHAIILLLDDSGETLRVVASRGYEDSRIGTRVPVGTGVIGVVAKKRKMMRIGNLKQLRAYASTIRREVEGTEKAEDLEAIAVLPGMPDAECQIAIPMTIKDTLIGVFSVESVDQKIFSKHEEELVSVVANQAASAIHNARLYQAVEERSKELAEAHERLKQLNETLEERVLQRTRQLVLANRELMGAQARLVQSGTLASMGRMVAGVVQEINTPISAIHSSGDAGQRAIAVLRKALQDRLAESDGARLDRALQVAEDTNKLIQEGTTRVVNVIRALKSFSRLDMAEVGYVQLQDGLESTIALLRPTISERIQIAKDYGSLPKVRCYVSQMNQVFMNVLTNAAQAIDNQGTISIKTYSDETHAVVEISDTGRGIPRQHLQRIFDPGFTTRGVGVGLGLGLSIAYRIVENHKGSIQVESEAGKGSTVTIRIPLEAE